MSLERPREAPPGGVQVSAPQEVPHIGEALALLEERHQPARQVPLPVSEGGEAALEGGAVDIVWRPAREVAQVPADGGLQGGLLTRVAPHRDSRWDAGLGGPAAGHLGAESVEGPDAEHPRVVEDLGPSAVGPARLRGEVEEEAVPRFLRRPSGVFRVAKGAGDAHLHLHGGLVGEGDAEDGAGRAGAAPAASPGQEGEVPGGEERGLARARRRGDRETLPRIEGPEADGVVDGFHSGSSSASSGSDAARGVSK